MKTNETTGIVTTIDVGFSREGHAGNWQSEADEFTGSWQVELTAADIAEARASCGDDATDEQVLLAAAENTQRDAFFTAYPGAEKTICFVAFME